MCKKNNQSWSVELCLQKIIHGHTAPSTKKSTHKALTAQNLNEALVISAKLVEQYGEEYLFYFDYLTQQLANLHQKSRKRDWIRNLAAQNLPLE